MSQGAAPCQAPRGPSPQMVGSGWRDRLKLVARGRWLMAGELRRLARLPAGAARSEISAAQQAAAARLLRHLDIDLRIRGLERLAGGPGLVIALHESMADALCLCALPLPLRFVARGEVFGWPGIGRVMLRLGHIAIDPEHGARAFRRMLREARTAIASGDHVVIFPQGTLLGIQTAFLPGAFRLAQCLDVPILPVVVTGTSRVWEHPFSARMRYGQRVSMTVMDSIGRDAVRNTDARTLCLRIQRAMKRVALDQAHVPPRHYEPKRDGTWPGFRFELDPGWAQDQDSR
jgi:1-acyl-sn-glycerol-3-phosphate acyltransferase